MCTGCKLTRRKVGPFCAILAFYNSILAYARHKSILARLHSVVPAWRILAHTAITMGQVYQTSSSTS